MRRPLAPFLTLAAATLAVPAHAREAVPLSPFDGPIRFAPHSPETVGPEHPFANQIAVDPVIDMPDRIGGVLSTFVRAKDFDAALADAIGSAGLRATDPQTARYRLVTTWLAFESPFKIGFSSHARATLRYELRRSDTGQVVFRRDVATTAGGTGGNAVDRRRGIARATLAANLAGAIWCLEQSPLGRAPEDCAVSPVGSFAAPIGLPVIRWR